MPCSLCHEDICTCALATALATARSTRPINVAMPSSRESKRPLPEIPKIVIGTTRDKPQSTRQDAQYASARDKPQSARQDYPHQCNQSQQTNRSKYEPQSQPQQTNRSFYPAQQQNMQPLQSNRSFYPDQQSNQVSYEPQNIRQEEPPRYVGDQLTRRDPPKQIIVPPAIRGNAPCVLDDEIDTSQFVRRSIDRQLAAVLPRSQVVIQKGNMTIIASNMNVRVAVGDGHFNCDQADN